MPVLRFSIRKSVLCDEIKESFFSINIHKLIMKMPFIGYKIR
jgi:hypothetical protein